MLKHVSPFELGATLYMPVLKPDALEYIAGTKLPKLRSMVLCLEDALAERDVLEGMDILEKMLVKIGRVKSESKASNFPLVFVRPRNIEMAKRIAGMCGIQNIDGFVAPKVRPGDYSDWVNAVRHTDLYIMPTLETAEVMDVVAMREMRDEFLVTAADRVLALRVGGNDLMSVLGVRRREKITLYESPLFYTISMLMNVMRPKGFDLTSPVFELFDEDDFPYLEKEVRMDVDFGFVGKTVIHPTQIDIVQNAFKVKLDDFLAAEKILEKNAPAVFKFGGSMCEPATHRNWAKRIISRKEVYGIAADISPIRGIGAVA